MSAFIRLRLVGLLLALAFGLGGIAGAFAQRMPTLDDLAIVEQMALGATPADICGKEGKALFDGVNAKAAHAAAGNCLPAHAPSPAKIALRMTQLVVEEPQIAAPVPLGRAHSCRAPPSILI